GAQRAGHLPWRSSYFEAAVALKTPKRTKPTAPTPALTKAAVRSEPVEAALGGPELGGPELGEPASSPGGSVTVTSSAPRADTLSSRSKRWRPGASTRSITRPGST